jgi:transcriptional regulator with XRE-family HTH domain
MRYVDSQKRREIANSCWYVDQLDNMILSVVVVVKGGGMPEPALGYLLRSLREERGLSLRELGQLAGIDHAYVHRLESGAKESPSEEVQGKLIRALKVAKREAEMLRFLAERTETDAGLVAHVLKDPTIPFNIFASAAGMVFRGTTRPDYAKRIADIRRILQGTEDG